MNPTLPELLRGIPVTDVYTAHTHIDMVTLHESPHRYGVSLILNRAYRLCAERVDLVGDAAWVQFRRALNRGVE